MFLHYFVSSENGEHRSIYIYTIREENQETKRVLTFDPTSFSNRSQRTIRNRSSPPFRSIAAIRGGTLFHEDTLQLPINERAPVFFKWNASRSHNRADLLKERVWAESSVGVPAHFRSTPDLRNDDKFQISRPRVPVLVHLPLYIRSTRAIEGRVRVLHLRFYLKPVETCLSPPPLLSVYRAIPRPISGKKKLVPDKGTKCAAVGGSIDPFIDWCHPRFRT